MSASGFDGLAYSKSRQCQRRPKWKGLRPQQRERKAKRKTTAQHVREIHDMVFAKSARCYKCGETEDETRRRFLRNGWAAPWRHQMDEILSRAQSRGLPVEVRFSTKNCRRACATCHSRRHGQRVVGDEKTAPARP